MVTYLDYAATTPVNYRFIEDASWYLQHKFHNPSSAYNAAAMVKTDIEYARTVIAQSINADYDEIIFTSGATEANNMVISNYFFYFLESSYEHPSVDGEYKYSINDLEKCIKQRGNDCDTILCSHMLANNETGTIFPVKELAKIAHSYEDIVFHTDATQAYGHIPIDVKDLDVDFLTVS